MTIQEAVTILGSDVQANGDLKNSLAYTSYTRGFSTITLDGDFDAEELIAIATYMKYMEKK